MKPVFKLRLSRPRRGLSKLAQVTLHLSEIAERLALEDRTLVSHVDGRAENVAEHSNMLAVIAPVIAELYYPQLNSNLIARYATLHDIVEAYVGDITTHNIAEVDFDAKQELEAHGLRKLEEDFHELPTFVAHAKEYEDQRVAEARFVRVLDKCMPHLLHFMDNGSVLRQNFTSDELLHNSKDRANSLRRAYPEFEQLIALREELSERMAKEFLEHNTM